MDRDSARIATLRKMVEKAGAKNVEAIHSDFLAINPLDQKYKDVKYILADPSCSGSGIVDRIDELIEQVREQNYLLEQKEPQKNEKEEKTAKSKRKKKNWKQKKQAEKLKQARGAKFAQEKQQRLAERREAEEKERKERLKTLSEFQISILTHCFKCAFSSSGVLPN